MKSNGVIISILAAIAGLMMLAVPAAFVQAVTVFFGIAAVVSGIVTLVVLRPMLADASFRSCMLVRGLTGILVGVLAVALPLAFAAAMWTIMIYVLAVYLVLSALLELYAAVRLKAGGFPVSQYVLEVIITLALAAFLFALPAEIGTLLVRICGGVLLLGAALMLFYALKFAPRAAARLPDGTADDGASADDAAGPEN